MFTLLSILNTSFTYYNISKTITNTLLVLIVIFGYSLIHILWYRHRHQIRVAKNNHHWGTHFLICIVLIIMFCISDINTNELTHIIMYNQQVQFDEQNGIKAKEHQQRPYHFLEF